MSWLQGQKSVRISFWAQESRRWQEVRKRRELTEDGSGDGGVCDRDLELSLGRRPGGLG